jgi:hypothetical protein
MQYPLPEKIGVPELLVGREQEFASFDRWVEGIPRRISKSRVILAQRKGCSICRPASRSDHPARLSRTGRLHGGGAGLLHPSRDRHRRADQRCLAGGTVIVITIVTPN